MTSMNGRRSAAMSGGRTAFSTAIRNAASRAPKAPSTETPGTSSAAMYRAAALITHWTSKRRGRIWGRSWRQPGFSA